MAPSLKVLTLTGALGLLFGCGVNEAEQNPRTPLNSSNQDAGPTTPQPTPVCDKDQDGSPCAQDCNDSDANVFPGATEIKNGVDDNCDGKIDFGVAGVDYDQDGTPFPEDCNDEQPLISPNAVEVAGDSVDNDCNGKIDEAVECGAASGTTAGDFAQAMGACTNVISSSFPFGNATSRKVRTKFGTSWTPRQGNSLVMLSTGLAVDTLENSSYRPQEGRDFNSTQSHPLYTAPRCAAQATTPAARDVSELKVTLKVPVNASSLSFQFNFFSAEYPEFVCTQYNDRFIAIVESSALIPSKLPPGQCKTGTQKPTCNVSYDKLGQPVTINNGFFDHCVSASGSGWSNSCTQGTSMLAGTGYDLVDSQKVIGGATGWLTTTVPVKPGEEMTLRLLVLDEGDGIYDSAVLIDNLQWGTEKVDAPVNLN